MTDPRILHAAARGARIERLSEFGCWLPTRMFDWQNMLVRVHPDDQHLMYGPISTALREAAVKPPSDFDMAYPHLQFFKCESWVIDWHYYRGTGTKTRRMFLLMLAEELSWSGL